MITFTRLKYLSFAHSAIYLVLLLTWALPGYDGIKYVCGWGHGVGWIAMALLCVVAVRLRVIPLWLGVTVAVIGAVGPFAGSAGFVLCERRRQTAGRAPERDMV